MKFLMIVYIVINLCILHCIYAKPLSPTSLRPGSALKGYKPALPLSAYDVYMRAGRMRENNRQPPQTFEDCVLGLTNSIIEQWLDWLRIFISSFLFFQLCAYMLKKPALNVHEIVTGVFALEGARALSNLMF